MKRITDLVLIVGIAALAFAGPANAGGDLKAAKAKATRVASNYVEKFGIYYPPSMWKAKCNRRGGSSWKCKVKTDTGQCQGSLKLRKKGNGFDAYAKRIGCGE
jgi:hypothetical protein